MKTLIDSCSRELRYFVGPSEMVYVVTWDYYEYLGWRSQRPGLKTKYVSTVHLLKGTRFPLVCVTEAGARRSDYARINEALMIVGAVTSNDFPPGRYVPYPEWSAKWAAAYYPGRDA